MASPVNGSLVPSVIQTFFAPLPDLPDKNFDKYF